MSSFTPDQLAAIDIARLGQDACVVAGPGSGKTTVLVERYRQLIESSLDPQEILAITFTEKAAANMKSRLARNPALASKLDRAWVSTVHSFCLRLLRENSILAGLDPSLAILDERQAALLQRRSLSDALDELAKDCPEEAASLIGSLWSPHADLIEVYDAIRSAGKDIGSLKDAPMPAGLGTTLEDIDQAVSAIGMLRLSTLKQREKQAALVDWNARVQAFRGRNQPHALLQVMRELDFGLTGIRDEDLKARVKLVKDSMVPDLRQQLISRLFAPERHTLLAVIARFDAIYSARKRERGVADFSDLEGFAIQLLEEHPEVRDRVRTQFRQVMIDEFQDTNGRQERLLALLRAPGCFYAVGDINQSIFSFRHADPQIFRGYRDQVRDSAQHHTELTENWRSRADVLLATETILAAAPGIEPRPLVPARELPPRRDPVIEVIQVEVDDSRMAMDLEARCIAGKILDLHGVLEVGSPGSRRPAEFRDFAVLVRTMGPFDALAKAFEEHEIPCIFNRRKGFFESREALDLTHLLRTISNPRDEAASAAVLRSPLGGVSDEALLYLETVDQNLSAALVKLEPGDKDIDPADLANLLRFRVNLRTWRAAQPYVSHDRILLRALGDCGFTWDPGTGSGANIEKFLAMARAVPPDTSLAQFIDELSLMRESDAREADSPVDEAGNAVRIMTTHSAKGLEFPIVFLPMLHKGVESDFPPFSFTTEHGFGVEWIDPTTGKNIRDAWHGANRDVIREKEEHEANRLLYVALTRAEEHLVLSYALEERSPRFWAALVEQGLGLAGSTGGVIAVEAPNGRTFKVKVERVRNAPAPMQSAFGFNQPAAPDILPRPLLQEQFDANVTVTALAHFQLCPRKYYLANYLGFEAAPGRGGKKLAAGELGNQVHQILAGQPVPNADPQAIRLAEVFRQSDLGRRTEQASRVEREFTFLLAIGEMVVRGSIDLWFSQDGEIVIVDYKTNDIAAADAARKAKEYELQLQVYALTLERVTGRKPARAYLHFLQPDQLIEVPLDSNAPLHVVDDLVKAQSVVQFPLRTGEHCRRCPFYRGLCPAGTPGHPI